MGIYKASDNAWLCLVHGCPPRRRRVLAESVNPEGDNWIARCRGRNHWLLFVDIGGGIGHQSRALHSWLSLSSRPERTIIFQDVPSFISLAKPDTRGVDAMVHDMFSPQPVKDKLPIWEILFRFYDGANSHFSLDVKCYYLRNILHDHNDTSCTVILDNIKAAIGLEFTLLIDDLVLPGKVECPVERHRQLLL